jgi:hypothetical protein
MSKKNHRPGPVPPGNQSQAGPGGPGSPPDQNETPDENAGAPFEEQDPERRLGNYGTAGEHPIQQPGRRNDGDTSSK